MCDRIGSREFVLFSSIEQQISNNRHVGCFWGGNQTQAEGRSSFHIAQPADALLGINISVHGQFI